MKIRVEFETSISGEVEVDDFAVLVRRDQDGYRASTVGGGKSVWIAQGRVPLSTVIYRAIEVALTWSKDGRGK